MNAPLLRDRRDRRRRAIPEGDAPALLGQVCGEGQPAVAGAKHRDTLPQKTMIDKRFTWRLPRGTYMVGVGVRIREAERARHPRAPNRQLLCRRLPYLVRASVFRFYQAWLFPVFRAILSFSFPFNCASSRRTAVPKFTQALDRGGGDTCCQVRARQIRHAKPRGDQRRDQQGHPQRVGPR